ncbi:hypothetical protein HY642_04050 [Candidatus Woesearchaeota archaeon]|nr:hypothetical protein [Candidatus Woesearchaeota archaeon]
MNLPVDDYLLRIKDGIARELMRCDDLESVVFEYDREHGWKMILQTRGSYMPALDLFEEWRRGALLWGLRDQFKYGFPEQMLYQRIYRCPVLLVTYPCARIRYPLEGILSDGISVPAFTLNDAVPPAH